MSSHNYAGCQDSACDLCGAYGEGYAAGKAKALFECAIATCHMSATPECRCSPCTALRYAIHSMSQGEPGPAAPDPKFGKCMGLGPGCHHEGMMVNSLCQRCWV